MKYVYILGGPRRIRRLMQYCGPGDKAVRVAVGRQQAQHFVFEVA